VIAQRLLKEVGIEFELNTPQRSDYQTFHDGEHEGADWRNYNRSSKQLPGRVERLGLQTLMKDARGGPIR
jgi:hypothetical protein